MKKMTLQEAAEYFGVSREAIHNRIRRGSLQSVMEDDVKMVLVDEKSVKKTVKKAPRARANSNDERYYKLLEEQNTKLQTRVEVLEGETRTLRDQKEQMLIEERQKIERIYKEKDEQLKNILQTLSSKLMLEAPLETEIEEEAVEAEIELLDETSKKIVSLKKYMKKNSFSEKKREKIKAKFKKRAKKDERIIIIGSKYYLDTAKYDYSDLIK
ncbi:DNA-binding protein [Sulfurimonas sp.]